MSSRFVRGAKDPTQVALLSGEALSSADLQAVLDLYEDGAVLIPPGQDVSSAVRGMASLREVAPGFLAIKPSVTMSVNKVIEADDIALVIGEWHLEGEGTEGKVRMSGTYTDVARRQGDGSWKFVIDNPDGVL